MTPLRQRMIDELRLRGLSRNTEKSYTNHISQLARSYNKSPALLTDEELRNYFLYHNVFVPSSSSFRYNTSKTQKKAHGHSHKPTHLVTFTLPEEFRQIARSNQKLIYGILFRTSAAALKKLAADPRFVGGQIGMTGVLHTWTRDLLYHPMSILSFPVADMMRMIKNGIPPGFVKIRYFGLLSSVKTAVFKKARPIADQPAHLSLECCRKALLLPSGARRNRNISIKTLCVASIAVGD